MRRCCAIEAARLPRTPLDLFADPSEDVLLRAEIDRAEVAAVSRAAGLADGTVERLLARAPAVAAISDDSVGELVGEGVLDEEAARDLGIATTVYQLGDGDEALVKAVRTAEFIELPGRRLRLARDLAALDAAAWRRALDGAGVEPPEGVTPTGYAAVLAGRVARLFPTDALRSRLPRPGEGLAAGLERLAPLLERNDTVVARDFDDLDLAGLEPGDVQELRGEHVAVAALAHSYPGLGLRRCSTTCRPRRPSGQPGPASGSACSTACTNSIPTSSCWRST